MVRAQVHSTKHVIQVTLTTAGTGATVGVNLANAVNRTTANLAEEVEEGCTIKAVYLEMWLIGDSLDEFFTFILTKLVGGQANVLNADMTNLFAYDNKKNVLFTSQGLASNDGVSGPVAIHRGWIKIPKGKQRFGLGDRIQFAVASRGAGGIKFCGMAIYKEYT